MDTPDNRSTERRRDDRRREDQRRQDDQLRALVRLDTNVSDLSRGVGGLRREISRRPTGVELADKRRRAIALGILGMLAIIFIHDVHVEHCGPGARAEAAIDAVANAPEVTSDDTPATLETVQKLINQVPPRPLCDLTFPLHGHDSEEWPSPAALTGGMLYLIGGGLLYLWARPRSPKEDA